MGEASSGPEKATILIVDDNPRNLQLLGTLLREAGYRIVVAQEGSHALRTVGKVRPDLILLDVMMPGMDGFETCQQLKADGRTRDLPVVYLTAHTETEDVIQGLERGAVDYITKPFIPIELLTRVRTHIELARQGRLQGVLELAGAVCHELHQPMQAVLGMADMLLSQTDDDGPVRERAVTIRREILRMRGITRKLARITRYETREYLTGRIVDLDRSATADGDTAERRTE